ncbi:hypothetical protein RW1_005_01920 [Rhodococcus wratislaviensis NBRC 100605]|uniref:Tyr recombinase domain-containing protein n=1 Tax=Rhodococcus wratislaviensis NBRC 100605 TaxID=1219028 RepID=X0PL61_RHOWR|nr:hypothetical protein RW1_005_01920 [Rhodococcus wratislaviensis NBRC 100605]
MAAATIRNRLRHLMSVEGRPEAEWFSPHAMRRACATHNYERGVDLAAIQQLLDHWTVASTMRYVRPSETFIEDARLNARRKARGSEKPNRRASTVIGTPWCSASTARAVRCSSRNRRRDIPSRCNNRRRCDWLTNNVLATSAAETVPTSWASNTRSTRARIRGAAIGGPE